MQVRVKFATRFDSPACLDISDLDINISSQSIRVSAMCRNDKILMQYLLELPLDK